MNRFRNVVVLAVALIAASMMAAGQAVCADKAKQEKSNVVLDDLQTAYNGESNANARYLAFAKKAQEEGYLKVANLFRATAKAEAIHARNHANVIKKFGVTPKATVEAPKVGSTRENLEASLKGETYEKDTMYPEFISRAEASNNKDALRTFTYAKDVETNHAKLFSSALANLEAWKAGGSNFYVCGECGNTVEKIDFTKCPVCGEPKWRYSKVD